MRPDKDGVYLVSWKGEGLVNPSLASYIFQDNWEYVSVFGSDESFKVEEFVWHRKLDIPELEGQNP